MAKDSKGAKKPLRLVGVRRVRLPQRVKCVAYPNRQVSRVFTARDVGRIVCRLINQNIPDQSAQAATGLREVSRVELRAELERCMPCSEEIQNKGLIGQSAAFAVALQQYLVDNGRVIAIALSVLLLLAFLPRLMSALPGVLLSLVPSAGLLAAAAIPQLILRLRSAQAANDAFFRLVAGGR